MIGLILRGKQIYDKFSRDEMTVYAAQASFFTIIAAFPFIMLLMAMIQLIPTITKSNLLMVITNIVPANLKSLVFGIVENIYTNSPATVLSVTAIAAIWSASRGMLSIERGLNRVFGKQKKRNYVVTRMICAGYTIVFMLICILTLVLLVLGSSIQGFVEHHFSGYRRDYPLRHQLSDCALIDPDDLLHLSLYVCTGKEAAFQKAAARRCFFDTGLDCIFVCIFYLL